MELFGFRLLVKDFAAAVHFWRDLMKFPLSFQDEGSGYAYFDTGKAGVELMRHDDFAAAMGEATPAPLPQGRQVVIDIRVDDVDQTYRELVAQGAILKPFSQDIMDVCYKAAQETYAEISAKNENFKKIYDSQQAFKKDGYLWMQIADYSFDTFMMMQQRKGTL